MRQLLITTTLFALAAHSAWAGPHFDGSYKGDGALGPMTLVLHETTAGAVSGTMSNEEGTYQVAGSTTGAGIHATFTGPEADDTFEGDLTLSGGRVSMDLTSTTDASIKVHLDFDRTGGAPTTAVGTRRTANSSSDGTGRALPRTNTLSRPTGSMCEPWAAPISRRSGQGNRTTKIENSELKDLPDSSSIHSFLNSLFNILSISAYLAWSMQG